MKYVEATEHPALRVVNNGFNANDAFLGHELPVLHANQDLLQLMILLRREALVDWHVGSFNIL